MLTSLMVTPSRWDWLSILTHTCRYVLQVEQTKRAALSL